MAIPTTPTDEIYPAYVDLTHNWRAVDVHWLRDRTVHVFDDASERDAVITAARQGQVAYLKNGETPPTTATGCGLVFRTATTAWETVRYPNLRVDSDGTTVTLKRMAAGSGITLKSDNSAEIAKLLAGTTTAGTTLDNTGISVKIGTKTVKLATDATALTVDSPVKVTGDIESTTQLKAPAITLTGNLNAVNVTASATVAAVTANVSGTVNAGLLNVGLAEVAIDTSLAVFRHKSSVANRLSFSSTGAAVLTGSTVTVNGATTLAGANTISGTASFTNATPPTLAPAGKTPSVVAGVYALNRAPTAGDNYPNGTIWFQI